MKPAYANIPAASLWDAVSKRNKVILLLNWATVPMTAADIRDVVYPGGGEVKRKRIQVLLTELKHQRIIEQPERCHWIGCGEGVKGIYK